MQNPIYNLSYIQHFKTDICKHQEPIAKLFQVYLSESILSLINELHNTVIEQAPPAASYTHTSSQPIRDRNLHSHSRPNVPFSNHRKFDKRKGGGYGNNGSENWNSDKPVFKPTMSMKQTKEGIDKDMNEIRTMLNKITNKNYETNRDTVMELITNIMESIKEDSEEYDKKIAQFVYDTASSNKFYGEVYADLYKELVERFQVYSDIMLQFVSTYNDQIGTIKYVDSNVDYDGFCAYTKTNEKRKATASFLVLLMKRGVLPTQVIIDLIVHFQDVFTGYIAQSDRVNEVDEITEVIFLFVSIGKDCIATCPEWKETILPQIQAASKLKAKEHKSLSSRAVFKYMDLLKLVS